MELLNTGTYLLLIDEEAEIKEGDYRIMIDVTSAFYSQFEIHIGKHECNNQWDKILAYYPLAKDAKELDLPCLPDPFEEEDDVEELAKIKFAVDIPSKFTAAQIWMDGYKAAQSSNKQFSLEDMKKAIEMARTSVDGRNEFDVENILGSSDGTYGISEKYSEEEIIQSLTTQQLPKEFVPKYVNEPIYTGDGCHEDNWIFKTITNSQGKEILQGKYIW